MTALDVLFLPVGQHRTRFVTAAFLGWTVLPGCAAWDEQAPAESLTAHVGVYSPPPPWIQPVRVAMASFDVPGTVSTVPALGSLAAGQLRGLVMQTGRFQVIHPQRDGFLDARAIESEPDLRRRVDYLLLGKVEKLAVTAGPELPGLGESREAHSTENPDRLDNGGNIHVECDVELNLVDPTTFESVVRNQGILERTVPLGPSKIRVLRTVTDAPGKLEIDESGTEMILRVALDEALRRMIPTIDSVLASRSEEAWRAGRKLTVGPGQASPERDVLYRPPQSKS